MICFTARIKHTYRNITTGIVFFSRNLEEFNFGCFFFMNTIKLNITDMNNIERTTLIIKLIERTEAKDRVFIINRSCGIEDILHLSKRLALWYEFESAGDLRYFDTGDYIILEELPLSNYNCRDQKIINEHKRKYIENVDINEENEILCNELFVNYTRRTNEWLKETYHKLFEQYLSLTINDIYAATKQLWFSSAKRYLKMPRYRLVAMISAIGQDNPYYNAMLVAIFLKNYLKNRMVHREYLPFPSIFITDIAANSYIENCISKAQVKNLLENNSYVKNKNSHK